LARSNPDIVRGQHPGAPALAADTERIAAALEPELRRIVDMTMERVAAIEQQSMREARDAMAASEKDSRDALERSSRLVDSVAAVTGTVGEMTSALQAEVEAVTATLRGLHGLRVRLPDQSADGVARDGQQAEPEGAPVPTPARPEPESGNSDPELEPAPELTEMFRAHIVEMRNDGKSREEAERVLKRFKYGRRFLGLLDDIYLSAPPPAARGRRGLFGRRRHRS